VCLVLTDSAPSSPMWVAWHFHASATYLIVGLVQTSPLVCEKGLLR